MIKGGQCYTTLEGALQDVFEYPTEDLWICWNGSFIPVGYKYDLSWMIDELQDLIECLVSKTEGQHRAEFSSDTFMVNWSLSWKEDALRVTSEWKSITGSCQDKLNGEDGVLEVSKRTFLCEWKRPLKLVLSALDLGGYTNENLPESERLQKLYSLIPQEGYCYVR